MKKILPVSLIINAVLIILAVLMILGPVVGNTFSRVNSNLSSVGGGAPQELSPGSGNYLELGDMPATSPQAVSVTDQFVSNTDSSVPAAVVERIVIKNADLAIVVSDVNGRMKNIQIMAEQMGGFVVSSNLYKSYTNNNIEVPEAQIVVRVPAEKLGDAIEQIKKDAVDVQNENVSGQDVTSEYVDLQSRLKNLEAAEAQLNDILKKATDTTDVVNIFNQLIAYREQIEVIKGQIKYYDEAAALSSITVRIIAEETVQPLVIGKWEPKGVALEAVQDLIDFLKGFTEFAIRFVIYILPSWIIVGIPLYLIFIGARALFRKMRGNRAKKEQPQEEEKK
jgi:hypothetical protein